MTPITILETYAVGPETAVRYSRGYTMRNVVPCCKLCNQRKRTTPYAEFIDWVSRVWRVLGPVIEALDQGAVSR